MRDPLKVLVIDDDADVRSVIRLTLARLGGMVVFEASSGAEGLHLAVAERPHGILLDVMMPGLDGPATLAALRAIPETSSIPVVFVTAKALLSEATRLRALGAVGVLFKPFEPHGLVAHVRSLLG